MDITQKQQILCLLCQLLMSLLLPFKCSMCKTLLPSFGIKLDACLELYAATKNIYGTCVFMELIVSPLLHIQTIAECPSALVLSGISKVGSQKTGTTVGIVCCVLNNVRCY